MCVFPLTQFILAAPDTEANDGLQPPAGQAVFAQSEALRGEKGAISSIPNAFISSNLTVSRRKKNPDYDVSSVGLVVKSSNQQ